MPFSTGRYLECHISSLPNIEFYPTKVEGFAAISQLYQFDITAQSRTANIDGDTLIGRGASLTLGANTQTPQTIHGVITEFSSTLSDDDSDLFTYDLQIQPWAVYLTLDQDCRGFVDQQVRQITLSLLKEKGFSPYDSKLIAEQNYPQLPYTVQYNETSLQFLSRLWAAHGIQFLFEQDKEYTPFVLYPFQQLASKNLGQFPFLFADETSDAPHITHWTNSVSSACQMFKSTVYNPKQPRHALEASAKLPSDVIPIPNSCSLHDPGYFSDISDLEHYNKVRAYAARIQAISYQASAHDVLGLEPGCRFSLAGDAVPTKKPVYISSLTYHAYDHSHLSRAQATGSDKPYGLRVDFIAHKTDHPFARDPKDYPRPHIEYPQTAIVVGPKGHESYAKGNAEVKVKFKWDRRDTPLSQLPWARCLQHMGGDQFGMQFLPRVGEEVNVEYLFGNPDKPIVTSSMANPDHPMPFPMHQSGIKTHIQDSDDEGHHLIFDHGEGNEAISLHAQGDLNINIKGSEQHHVAGNDITLIEQGDAEHILEAGDYRLTAEQQISLVCGNSEIRLTPQEIIIQSDLINMDHDTLTPEQIDTSIPAENILQATIDKLGGIQSSAKKTDEENLVTIKLQPRWRNVCTEVKPDDFASLLRLPSTLQSQVLEHILSQYQPDSVEAAEKLQLLTEQDCQQWPPLIKDEELTANIYQSLSLAKPPSLPHGWIYIFAKCADGPAPKAFEKTHLFKEYEVKPSSDPYQTTFAEVDLSDQAGLDQRASFGDKQCIELPYGYSKNGELIAKFTDVTVFFSSQQLSWPRLQRYGGLSNSDPRLQHITDKAQLDLIHNIQQYRPDTKLLTQRAGQAFTANELDDLYRIQNLQNKPTPVLENAEQKIKPSDWQATHTYYLETTQAVAYVLLDAPLGMVLSGQQFYYLLQQAIIRIVNAVEHDELMKVALLTYHFYFDFRADGLPKPLEESVLELDGMNALQKENLLRTAWLDDKLFGEKPASAYERKAHLHKALKTAQANLSLHKILYQLKHSERSTLKTLLKAVQTISIEALKVESQGHWANQRLPVLGDIFAVSPAYYSNAQTAYWGLWAFTRQNVDDIDHGFPNESRYYDYSLTKHTVLDGDPISHITGYHETIIERQGYKKIKQVKTYVGNQLHASTTKTTVEGYFPLPVGLNYLADVFADKSPDSQFVLPQLDKAPSFHPDDAETQYHQGQASYLPATMQAAQKHMQKIMQQQLQADQTHKATDTLTSWAGMTASKTHTWLNALSMELTHLLEHEEQQAAIIQLKQRFCAVLTDTYGLARDELMVGGQDGQPIMAVIQGSGVKAYRQHYTELPADNHGIFRVQHRFSKPLAQHVNGQHDIFSEQAYAPTQDVNTVFYANADDAKQASLNELEGADHLFQTLSDNNQNPDTIRVKRNSALIASGAIHSALYGFAVFDMVNSFRQANKSPDFYNMTAFSMSLLNLVSSTESACEFLAEHFNWQRPLEAFRSHRLIKPLVTERLLFANANMLEVVGIASSIYSLVTSGHQLLLSFRRNDPMMMWSNAAQFAADSLLAFDSYKSVTSKIAERQAKNSGQLAAEIETEAIQKRVEKIGVEKSAEFGISSLMLDSCEFIGGLFASGGTILWLITVLDIATIILAYFKDTRYQTWAKSSPFADKDHSDQFKTPAEAYAALMNLMMQPSVNVLHNKQNSRYSFILDAPGFKQEQLILHSYVACQPPMNMVNSLGATPNHNIYPLQLKHQPIYEAETLHKIGVSAEAEQHDLNLAQLVTAASRDEYIQRLALSMAGVTKSQLKKDIRDLIKKTLAENRFSLYAAGQVILDKQFTLPNNLVVDDTKTDDVIDYFKRHNFVATGHQMTLNDIQQKNIANLAMPLTDNLDNQAQLDYEKQLINVEDD